MWLSSEYIKKITRVQKERKIHWLCQLARRCIYSPKICVTWLRSNCENYFKHKWLPLASDCGSAKKTLKFLPQHLLQNSVYTHLSIKSNQEMNWPKTPYLKFPLRSPAARCWPSGLISSTLMPDLPSWLVPSAFSASAFRYWVSSSTYTILFRSCGTDTH